MNDQEYIKWLWQDTARQLGLAVSLYAVPLTVFWLWH
jgi:hypothetical protein